MCWQIGSRAASASAPHPHRRHLWRGCSPLSHSYPRQVGRGRFLTKSILALVLPRAGRWDGPCLQAGRLSMVKERGFLDTAGQNRRDKWIPSGIVGTKARYVPPSTAWLQADCPFGLIGRLNPCPHWPIDLHVALLCPVAYHPSPGDVLHLAPISISTLQLPVCSFVEASPLSQAFQPSSYFFLSNGIGLASQVRDEEKCP